MFRLDRKRRDNSEAPTEREPREAQAREATLKVWFVILLVVEAALITGGVIAAFLGGEPLRWIGAALSFAVSYIAVRAVMKAREPIQVPPTQNTESGDLR